MKHTIWKQNKLKKYKDNWLKLTDPGLSGRYRHVRIPPLKWFAEPQCKATKPTRHNRHEGNLPILSPFHGVKVYPKKVETLRTAKNELRILFLKWATGRWWWRANLSMRLNSRVQLRTYIWYQLPDSPIHVIKLHLFLGHGMYHFPLGDCNYCSIVQFARLSATGVYHLYRFINTSVLLISLGKLSCVCYLKRTSMESRKASRSSPTFMHIGPGQNSQNNN